MQKLACDRVNWVLTPEGKNEEKKEGSLRISKIKKKGGGGQGAC